MTMITGIIIVPDWRLKYSHIQSIILAYLHRDRHYNITRAR